MTLTLISWRNCCTKCNLRSGAQKIVDQKEAQMITFETTSNETTQRKHETGETTVLFESFRWLAASLFVWVAALCRASPSTKRCAATCQCYGACNLTSSQWKPEEAQYTGVFFFCVGDLEALVSLSSAPACYLTLHSLDVVDTCLRCLRDL